VKLFPRWRRGTGQAPNAGRGGILPGGPDAVEVGGRSVRVGDEYAATLVVTGYPAEVGAGWLEPILAYPGRVDVVLHIEPVPPQVAAQRRTPVADSAVPVRVRAVMSEENRASSPRGVRVRPLPCST